MREGILHGAEQFDTSQYELSKQETDPAMERFIDETVTRLAGADSGLKSRLMSALGGDEAAGETFGTRAAQSINDSEGRTLREKLAAAFVKQDPKNILDRQDHAETLLEIWVRNMRTRN
jgi:hypothetical protein